jgi:Icc-related predicted phosphoesterase
MREHSDILLLGGDLTDYGLPEEAEVLVEELDAARDTPILAVLGNHDFQSEQQDDVKEILAQAGVQVLDGDALEFEGIGFTGVKGFIGGFDSRMLQAWGEPSIKQVVQEVGKESSKLDEGLERLPHDPRIVLLHYSPIQATVCGESPEIFPFLGSSCLEAVIQRHSVLAAFHGHAHHGSPEGRTRSRVPVYNVAMPLLKRLDPDHAPFRVIEVKRMGDSWEAQMSKVSIARC